MPIWDFVCDACGHIEKDVVGVGCENGSDSVRPDHCGQPMDTYYGNVSFSARVFEPFKTRNLHPDGEEVEVKNSDDLRRYQREFGVRLVDDPDLKSYNGVMVNDPGGIKPDPE